MIPSREVQRISEAVGRLGLRVVRRYDDRLINVIRDYVLPSWHPCPCSHTEEERVVVEGHLEDLAARGELLLNPVVVATVLGVRVIFAPTCVIEAALALYNRRRGVLENVKVEVWDLGDLSDKPFLAKAAAALLCIVYSGKRHSEVRLNFVEDYLRHEVLEVAKSRGSDEALRFVDRLARRIDITPLVNRMAEITGLSGRSIYRYLTAVLNDGFIEELRDLVRKTGDVEAVIEHMRSPRSDSAIMTRLYINMISSRLGTGQSDLEPLTALGSRALFMLASVVKELTNAGDARDLVSKVLRHLRNGEVYRAVLLISRKYEELFENRPTTGGKASMPEDAAEASGSGAGKAQGQGRQAVGEEVLIGPPRAGGAVRPVDGTEPAPKGPLVFIREFKFRCVEGGCGYITYVKELSRASLSGDAGAMLNAALSLAGELARAVGNGDLSIILNSLVGEPGLAQVIANVLSAVRGGDLRALCSSFNDLVSELMKRLPNNVRDALRDRAGRFYVNCARYPGRGELGIT